MCWGRGVRGRGGKGGYRGRGVEGQGGVEGEGGLEGVETQPRQEALNYGVCITAEGWQ